MNINIGMIDYIRPEHQHNFYEAIIYTKGTGYLQTDKERITFTKGTIIIVPPKTPHYSVSSNDFERIFINECFDNSLSTQTPVVLQNGIDGDGFILANLIYQNRFHHTEYLSALLNAFTSYILKAIETDDEMSSTIRSITNEIIDNFCDCSLNLTDILCKSGYSEDYIRAQFKRKTGRTPVRFLTEIRIAHACMMIDIYKRSLSLSQIAEKCGYTDYIYFSRRFKEIKGISPREYMYLK